MPDSNDLAEARKVALDRLYPPVAEGHRDANEQAISGQFVEILARVDMLVPLGREKSLAITKLQEAHFWALQAVKSTATKYTWSDKENPNA